MSERRQARWTLMVIEAGDVDFFTVGNHDLQEMRQLGLISTVNVLSERGRRSYL